MSRLRTILSLGIMVLISLFQRYLLNLLRKAVTFYFFGAQVFNNIPLSIKETKALLIFKTLIKDFYIENS